MKKWILLFLTFSFQIFCQELDDSLFYIENTPPPFYPFSLSGSYLSIHPAHFKTPGFEEDTITYKQWETAFAYTHIFSQECGLIFGAGWVATEVDMQNNPEFNETRFNYVNFSTGIYTKSFPEWTWTLTISAFFDLEEFSLIDYTLYQGVLWGKYNFCPWLELDFGLITEIGLKKEKVWPVLGFVLTPKDYFRLYAVYPIQISLEYDLFKCLTAAASIRFIRNRHRLQEEAPNSQGIFEYHTKGAEFDLIFRPLKRAFIKGFIGSSLGGALEVSDRNDSNSTHYKFKDSLYSGVSAVLSF